MSTLGVTKSFRHPSASTPVTATLTATTDAEVIAAPSAGFSIYVTDLLVSNGASSITRLDLKEGSGGTIRLSQHLAATGGGFSKEFDPVWRLPPAIGLFGALGTAVTDVRVNVTYFVDRSYGI